MPCTFVGSGKPAKRLVLGNPGHASTEMVPKSVELKAIMWVAFGWYGVIGPYFFENKQGCTYRVNQANYCEMI